MKKYHVTLALISIVFFSHKSYCCPCSASTTDTRPFFEQYESTDNAQQDEIEESTDDTTQTEQS
jgi:hypothetical protein